MENFRNIEIHVLIDVKQDTRSFDHETLAYAEFKDKATRQGFADIKEHVEKMAENAVAVCLARLDAEELAHAAGAQS